MKDLPEPRLQPPNGEAIKRAYQPAVDAARALFNDAARAVEQEFNDPVEGFTLDSYQAAAVRTMGKAIEPRTLSVDDQHLITAALGLAGEAGEFADQIKKWFAHGHDLDFNKLDREAGDILWYLALYAEVRGDSLSSLARLNIAKLAARYPEGFTTERSINRGDE